MANRKLPFGYCMQGGQICVVEAEAEVVRMIFTSYAGGNSYETLAEWLNRGKLPYLPGRQWNKNVVARMLQDERYLGDPAYPSIIAAEIFGSRKPTVSGKSEHPQLKESRILARCGICGEVVRRERKDTWRCPQCMTSAAETTDKRLMDGVEELLSTPSRNCRFSPKGNVIFRRSTHRCIQPFYTTPLAGLKPVKP